MSKALDKLIVVGDRVLIRPKSPNDKTKTGLFLPPGVQERERVQSGYILKVGPGYPIPVASEVEEPWKKEERVKYIPLQAKVGDLAIYLHNGAYEINYEDEKYYIVSQSSILMLVRDEDLFI